MAPPSTQTSRNQKGWGRGPAISLAVRKMDEPMMPLARSRTESKRLSPRISDGWGDGDSLVETVGEFISPHTQFVRRFERRTAAAADHRAAIATGEGVGNFLGTVGTVKQFGFLRRLWATGRHKEGPM